MEHKLLKKIKEIKHYKNLYNVPLELWLSSSKKVPNQEINKLKIAMFVHTCFGLGDVIYGLKIYKYMEEWYNIKPDIFTTRPDAFYDNGVKKHVYFTKLPGVKYTECEHPKNMRIYKDGKMVKNLPEYDLLLVTPWIGTDFEVNYNFFKQLFPFSNQMNTFLFSVYNAPDIKKYRIPVGLGENHLGILLTDVKKSKKTIQTPYIMTHISHHDYVDSFKCFSNFVKLVCKKYSKKHERLDIITPGFIIKNPKLNLLSENIIKKGYYKEVYVVSDTNDLPSKNAKGLVFRNDLKKVSHEKYVNLFKHALPDVLVTGNRSISDIVSCCPNFTVYYQIMPWEKSFINRFADIVKKDYLKYIDTSCGTENMKITNSNLNEIRKNHDFRKKGKPYVDAIMKHILEYKNNESYTKLINLIMQSRKKSSLLKKIKVIFGSV